jgi:hypothetical protein
MKSAGLNGDAGAQQYFERIGKAEGRMAPLKRVAGVGDAPPASLFVMYRKLRLSGLKEGDK